MAWIGTGTAILWAAGWLVLVMIVTLLHGKKFGDLEKKVFFALIAIPTIIATLYVAGFTIHKNVTSVTEGPVHWHMDYQVWACGERLDLVDPDFPSNKIGTPLFHEHNDDRLHVEGTVNDLADVDVGSYFATLGGRLTSTNMVYPVDGKGIVELSNGDLCNGQASTLTVYVNGERINNPDTYLYYPHPLVPPGDCLIFEFGPGDAQFTDKICESWTAQGWTYDNYQELRVSYDEDTRFFADNQGRPELWR